MIGLVRAGGLCLVGVVLPSWSVRAQTTPPTADTFAQAIVRRELAADERAHTVAPAPNVFLQGRFSRGPIAGTGPDLAPQNVQMTRIETGWFGALNAHIGVGFELQCARFDHLTGDPMTGETVHAFDIGYRRTIGDAAHLSVELPAEERADIQRRQGQHARPGDARCGVLKRTWRVPGGVR